MSKNARHYRPDVLRRAVPLFEDLNVFIHKFDPAHFDDDADHLSDNMRKKFPDGVAGNFIGYLENVRVEKVDGKEAMVAELHVADPKMREVFIALDEDGRLDKLGFSIDVEGRVGPGKPINGVPTQEVESIEKAHQLDVVTHAAAGGRGLRLLAGVLEQEVSTMKKFLIRFVQSFMPELLKGQDVEKIDEKVLAPMVEKAAGALAERLKKNPIGEAQVDEALDSLLKEAMALLKAGKVQEAMEKLQMAMESLGAAASPYRAPAEKKAEESEDGKKGEEEKKGDEDKSEDPPASDPPPADPPKKEEGAKESVKESKEFKTLSKRVEDQGKIIKDGQARESAAVLVAKLIESGLPMKSRERIAGDLKGKVFTEAEAEERINSEKDYMAALTEEGAIRHLGSPAGDAEIRVTASERTQKMVDLLVDPDLGRMKETKDAYKGIEAFGGLREAWSAITGDRRVTFNRKGMSPRMVEAVTSDFPKVFGDSITRHLLRLYRTFPQNWRKVSTVIQINDFRSQRPIRWGTFDDLAVVAENGVFTDLNNPTETETVYAAGKRGKKFAITREMILRDDLRQLRRIGPMMARAANRTLEKFVWSLVIGTSGGGAINSDLVSDGTAIYTVGHANLGAVALDADSLRAALIRLMLQVDEDGNEVQGFMKPWAIVPIELGPTLDILLTSEQRPGTANNDVNENKDAAVPIKLPASYLEEPTVLVQDDPRTGDVFTNERITMKVRHEYGGAITAFQGFDGNIVP